MTDRSKRQLLMSAAACALGFSATRAAAQGSFPERPVKVIVPFPPGGSFDVIARGVAQKLTESWKQAVVVENRAGAGGNVGAQAVIAAPADGYTLLLWGDGVLSNPLMYAKPPFNAIQDLAGVALVATAPQILVANPKSGIATIQDILSAQQTLHYGTAGNGAPGHLAAELLKRGGARQLNHVPYRGGGLALSDLMGEQIQLVSTGVPGVITLIRSGRVKAVAVTAGKRMKILPEVPTIAETLPGFEVDTWYGFMAPKATPGAIRSKISADVRLAMGDADLQKRLADAGFEISSSTPTELDAKMLKDVAFWREQVAKSGAHAD